jgi:hypothetical protein
MARFDCRQCTRQWTPCRTVRNGVAFAVVAYVAEVTERRVAAQRAPEDLAGLVRIGQDHVVCSRPGGEQLFEIVTEVDSVCPAA